MNKKIYEASLSEVGQFFFQIIFDDGDLYLRLAIEVKCSMKVRTDFFSNIKPVFNC